MAKVTIVLEDTPTGAVSLRSSFRPAVGQPTTQAQTQALEAMRGILQRTGQDWGLVGAMPLNEEAQEEGRVA